MRAAEDTTELFIETLLTFLNKTLTLHGHLRAGGRT